MKVVSVTWLWARRVRASGRKLKIALLALAALVAASWWMAPSSAGSRGHGAARAGTASANPLTSLVRTALDAAPIAGRVEQRRAAGHYAYLAVRDPDGRLVWVVTLGAGQPTGTRVNVRSMGRQTNFYSRRLQQTFPELVFGIVSPAG